MSICQNTTTVDSFSDENVYVIYLITRYYFINSSMTKMESVTLLKLLIMWLKITLQFDAFVVKNKKSTSKQDTRRRVP